MNEKIFPRFLDKPRLIGIFEMDEFLVAFGTMVFILSLSLVFPKIPSLYVMIASITIGLTLSVMLKKFKKNRPDGYTLQKAYSTGLFSPSDDKKAFLNYKYLKRLKKVVPYGFTKVLYN